MQRTSLSMRKYSCFRLWYCHMFTCCRRMRRSVSERKRSVVRRSVREWKSGRGRGRETETAVERRRHEVKTSTHMRHGGQTHEDTTIAPALIPTDYETWIPNEAATWNGGHVAMSDQSRMMTEASTTVKMTGAEVVVMTREVEIVLVSLMIAVGVEITHHRLKTAAVMTTLPFVWLAYLLTDWYCTY